MSISKQNHANLFDDDAEMNFQIERLKEKVQALEHCDKRATKQILTLEDSIMRSAEDAKKQFTMVSDKWCDFRRMMDSLKEEQEIAKAQDTEKLLELKRMSETYREELYSMKKERERLSDLQEKQYQALLKEPIPKSITALQSMLVSYRKLLAVERANKESLSLKLRSEMHFMEEQLKAEQARRLRMESSLASELHGAHGEIVLLKSAKYDMDKEMKKYTDIQKELDNSKASLQALKEKSDQIIQSLKEKVRAETNSREQVEQTLAETRHKLKSLHGALEASEQVQRDFVRLSQSLQVELENVRQERASKEKFVQTTSTLQADDDSSITIKQGSTPDNQPTEK